MQCFRKKKTEETPLEIISPKHEHIYKDMPWYMTTAYSSANRTAEYEIIEPYICISCGHRINKTLERTKWSNISAEDREKFYADIYEKYKDYLKPRAIVEDMINNIILVKDAHHLHMVETMRGLPYIGCGTSAKTLQTNGEIGNEIPT